MHRLNTWALRHKRLVGGALFAALSCALVPLIVSAYAESTYYTQNSYFTSTYDTTSSGGSVVITATLNQHVKYGRLNIEGNRLYPEKTGQLINPTISVTYLTEAWLLDGNDNPVRALAKDETVPEGSRVLFKFVPHSYDHIYWFATGGAYDSPYGDWVAGAGKPANICQEKNIYIAQSSVQDQSFKLDLFASLSTNPPTKNLSVTGPVSCANASDGISKICTLTGEGQVNARFDFAATNATFWPGTGSSYPITYRARIGRLTQDTTTGAPFCDTYNASNGNVSIPSASVPFSLLAGPDDGGAPTFSGVSGGGACTVGEEHTITFTGNDPDGDTIRYAIDWNADGTVDEYVPSSGFVSSGTPGSASRTYATPGEKTVRVRVEDSKGMTSGWTTVTFTCSDGGTPTPPPTSCPVGYSLQNDVCVFVGCPIGYEQQGDLCVLVPAPQCTAGLFCRVSSTGQHQVWQRGAPPQCAESFASNCPMGWTCASGACVPPQAGGNITAIPSLVNSGAQTTVQWTTSEMLPGSCVVSSLPSSIPSNATTTTASGSFLSLPITQQTTFSLLCLTLDGNQFADSASVNIVPNFEEQ